MSVTFPFIDKDCNWRHRGIISSKIKKMKRFTCSIDVTNLPPHLKPVIEIVLDLTSTKK